MNVRIHANILPALKSENHDEIRRLATHTWQRHEFIQCAWNVAAKALDKRLAGGPHESRFVAIEAHRINQLLDLFDAECRKRSRRSCGPKQPRRRRVRRRVLCASR